MLRPLVAIARRDAQIAMTRRSTFITRPLGLAFTLALFYFVSRLVSVSRFPTPDAYFAFVAVGIVIYGLVRSALEVPMVVREELVAGTYERLELSAAGATAGVLGMFLFPFLYALLLSAFILAVAAAVFGMDIQWSTAPFALPLGLLSALAFAPFGLLFAALTVGFKQTPGQGVVLPTLALVSGLYFPVDLLPDWLRWLSEVQPLTPTVDLMRHVLIGQETADPVLLDVAKLLAFIAVAVPLAVAAVSAARRVSRRRGTILES